MGARHIGLYLPNDGEIDPGLFMAQSQRRGMHFYLPVLHPIHSGQLAFCRYDAATPMAPNRFGIPEPVFHSRRIRPAWSLDVVLMPLVGFDEEGGRLGMGRFLRPQLCVYPDTSKASTHPDRAGP